MKGVFDRPTANIILKREKPKVFSKIYIKKEVPTFTTLSIVWEVTARASSQNKYMNVIQTRKKSYSCLQIA